MGLSNNLGKLSNMITSTGSAVGIGTTSPNFILDVKQATNQHFYVGAGISVSGAIVLGGGNDAANANIPIEMRYATTFAFVDAGTETMRISGANVGIGTISPNYSLHINTATTITRLQITNTTTGTTNASGLQIIQDGNNTTLSLKPSGFMSFETANTERLRITSAGNVGIGTNDPQLNLQITTVGTSFSSTTTYSSSTSKGILLNQQSGSASGNALWFNNSGLFSAIASTRESTGDWGTDIRFFTHPQVTTNQFDVTERMRITGNGNVGIGTTSPSYILDVTGTSRFNASATTYNGTVQSLLISSSANSALTINGGIGSYAYQTFAQNQVAKFELGIDGPTANFYISNVPQTGSANANLSINYSTGNVGIGTLSPNAKLEVFKSTATMTNDPGNSQMRVSASSIKFLSIGYDPTANVAYLQGTEAAVAWRPLHLNNNGAAVYAGSVRLDTLSDVRIKDNIQPITNALNKVLSITGKKFHLKDEEESKLRYGFIAQELEGILDEFVIQTDMTFKKDDLIVENVKSVDNWASSWSALLVEAIKDMHQQNQDLKSRLDKAGL